MPRASRWGARLRSAVPVEDVVLAARFLRQLPGFLRHPLTLPEARAILARRLERREADFLELVRDVVYASARNPYHQLLRLAGCEYGDVERLVRADGVEGALVRLYRHGVYLTVDELNLDAETTRADRGGRRNEEPEQEQASAAGFGLTMDQLTADILRRMRLPSDTEGVIITGVEPGSPGFRAGLQRGDIILQVNRQPVASPGEASKLLGQVADGGTAFLLLLRNGQETFVTVRKR